MDRTRVNFPAIALLMLLAVSTAGCELAEGIFKAGMWVGIIMVAIIVLAVMWVLGKIRS